MLFRSIWVSRAAIGLGMRKAIFGISLMMIFVTARPLPSFAGKCETYEDDCGQPTDPDDPQRPGDPDNPDDPSDER